MKNKCGVLEQNKTLGNHEGNPNEAQTLGNK